MKKFKLFIVSFLFLLGCDKESSTPEENPQNQSFDRSVMLVNWTDNIIIPSYNGFLNTFETFTTNFETFSNNPNTDNLATLRNSWIDAYKAWQHIDMFEIGPAEEVGLRLHVNTYPTDVDLLETFVENGNVDFDLPANRDVKGFPAIDYLLQGLAATDQEVVAKYVDANAGQKYLTYLDLVIQDIETRVQAVANDWSNGYRDTFVSASGSSASASVDRYVNDYIFYYEKYLRAGKMGIPLGLFSGTQLPANVEAFYHTQVSNALFLEGLSAVENFFNGKHYGSNTTGESLASYLNALNNEDLSTTINNQFEAARNAVNTLEPFRTELENNNPATNMLTAYQEVQKNVINFKTDMVSALSIAIDYVDADGD